MKLRLDLLKHLTAEDIAEAAVAEQHRYKAEPTFSKTGKGYLAPQSAEDSEREVAHCIALTERLMKRLREAENAGNEAS